VNRFWGSWIFKAGFLLEQLPAGNDFSEGFLTDDLTLLGKNKK
jgi:hypothetical protein